MSEVSATVSNAKRNKKKRWGPNEPEDEVQFAYLGGTNLLLLLLRTNTVGGNRVPIDAGNNKSPYTYEHTCTTREIEIEGGSRRKKVIILSAIQTGVEEKKEKKKRRMTKPVFRPGENDQTCYCIALNRIPSSSSSFSSSSSWTRQLALWRRGGCCTHAYTHTSDDEKNDC